MGQHGKKCTTCAASWYLEKEFVQPSNEQMEVQLSTAVNRSETFNGLREGSADWDVSTLQGHRSN